MPHDHHDWLSDDYVDEWVQDWSARTQRIEQLRQVAVAIPVARDEEISVLDVGGGWGPLSEQVLAYRPRARITLVDLAPRMLDHARDHLAPYADRVRLERRDLTEPDWASGLGDPFGAVVSSLAIHNLVDPALIGRVYRDILGLLAPGGWFFNLEIVFSAGPGPADVARRLQADHDGADPDLVAAGPRLQEAGSGRPRPGSRSLHDQLTWLHAAGFGHVDCLWLQGSTALLAAEV